MVVALVDALMYAASPTCPNIRRQGPQQPGFDPRFYQGPPGGPHGGPLGGPGGAPFYPGPGGPPRQGGGGGGAIAAPFDGSIGAPFDGPRPDGFQRRGPEEYNPYQPEMGINRPRFQGAGRGTVLLCVHRF